MRKKIPVPFPKICLSLPYFYTYHAGQVSIVLAGG